MDMCNRDGRGHDVEKFVVLTAVAISSFLPPFMGSATDIVIPSVGREFKADAIILGWVSTSYLLAAGIFSVPFGKIADIKGRKKLFVAGLFAFSIASFLSGISPSVEHLIVFRVIQGMGGAMIYATGYALITSVFPRAERGRAIGISASSTYTGLCIGPTLGGFLTQNFGWRSVFLINVPIASLAAALALWKLKGEWVGKGGEKFDFLGSVIYSLTLLLIIYGLTKSSMILSIGGLVLLLVFILYESRIDNPVLEVGLFRRNVTFSLSCLAALLNYAATFAVEFILSLYLQYAKGFDPQQAGMVLIAQPALMAVFAPVAGWLSDRVEPRMVASAGMAVTTLALLVFSWIESSTSLNLIIMNLMLLGFGLGLFTSPNTNAIMSSVERKFFGTASATVATVRLIGQILSMALTMFVFSIVMGTVEITPEYYALLIKSSKMVFRIFTTLCFIGIFASLGRGKIRPD